LANEDLDLPLYGKRDGDPDDRGAGPSLDLDARLAWDPGADVGDPKGKGKGP
jgi:hypothetical protein